MDWSLVFQGHRSFRPAPLTPAVTSDRKVRQEKAEIAI